MKIKDLAAIGEKYATVTPMRADEYVKGVTAPRKDWAQCTEAAETAYKEGVTKAAAAGRFGKGVRAAGTSKWQRGAIQKGGTRFATGVSMAKDDYQNGYAPYHQVLSSLTLPARFSKRDPRNLARVAAIATALGKKKESIG